jgi:flavodoxin
MKSIVLYDSAYGNTAKIGDAIRAGLPEGAMACEIADMNPGALPAADLLVIGSPTQSGRPTAATIAWIEAVPRPRLINLRVACFDTRLAQPSGGWLIGTLTKLVGYAAPRIASHLRKRGALVVAPPEGFLVDGREGPLRAGERERAISWAHALAAR